MSYIKDNIKVMMIIPLLLISLDVLQASHHVKIDRAPKNKIVDENPSDVNSNYTTCADFLEGTSFNVSSVIDKDWSVFYVWNMHYEEPYQVRFRKPSSTLIDRFRVEVGNVSHAPDWNNTAFFMESSMDLSALFIMTSTPGKFKVITSLVFKYNLDEEVIFAMKVVDPGYLAFMNCKIQVVVALATPDNFPKDSELEDAAKLFKIKNPHGYPYNVHDATLNYDPALDDEARDEEQIEVEVNSGMLD